MSFFYQKHFNIFTDTSDKAANTARGDFKVTCPGFLATYDGNILGSGIEVYIDEDTLFGEAKAIEQAVRWIQNTLTRYGYRINNSFNIFSDNLPVVATICNYINLWISEVTNNRQSPLSYTGQRPDICWENVCYNVAYTIFVLNYPIFIYYTPGHVPIYNLPFKAFDSTVNKFVSKNTKYHQDINKSDIEDYMVYEMATFNNMVDIMTRNYLFRNKQNIEKDINEAGDYIALGDSKVLPLRWPIIVSNVPELLQHGLRANFNLPQIRK